MSHVAFLKPPGRRVDEWNDKAKRPEQGLSRGTGAVALSRVTVAPWEARHSFLGSSALMRVRFMGFDA